MGIKSNEDIEWVCCTCQKYLNLRKIPPLSVKNGCKFPEIPPELKLTEMEECLISPSIPFMQLMEKPRGGQKNLRGNVVNVPSDVNKTIKSLPRTLAETETIQVKLKRKLQFKHHVYHESVRPFKCIVALHWLLRNSAVFQNEGISIRENWNILEEQKGLVIMKKHCQTINPTRLKMRLLMVMTGQKMKTLKVGSQEIQTHCYILYMSDHLKNIVICSWRKPNPSWPVSRSTCRISCISYYLLWATTSFKQRQNCTSHIQFNLQMGIEIS